jgi:hypothetical protein
VRECPFDPSSGHTAVLMAVQPAELVLPKIETRPPSVSKSSDSQSDLKKNVHEPEKLNEELKWSSIKQLAASMVGVILIIVEQQMAIAAGGDHPWPLRAPQDEIKETLNYFRWAILILTVLSILYLNEFYKSQCGIMILKNHLPASATVFSSAALYKPFLLEAFILSIHPFPYVDSLPVKSPHVYLAFTLFPFVRVLFAFRTVSFFSNLNSTNGRFIGALTGVDFTSSFMLKTTLRNSPGKCIGCSLLVLLLFAGYSLYVTETLVCSYERSAHGLNDPLACGGNELLSFLDSEWILIITILTVGYGDLYPYTHGGRFIAVAGGFLGTVMTAVTIALTADYLTLSRSESKVVSFLTKNANKKVVLNQAARAVQASYRLYLARKKPEVAKRTHPQKKLKSINKLTHHLFQVLTEFRCAKRYAVSHDGVDPLEKQIIMLETMEVNIEEMKEKVEILFNHHENLIARSSKGKEIYYVYCL